MKRLLLTLLLFAIFASSHAAAQVSTVTPKGEPRQKARPAIQERIAILSIIPAQGEPGITVTLSGSGFSDNATVFLGSTEIPARLIGTGRLSFDIPKLAAGLYAMFVKNKDGTFSKTYSFNITPLKPVAESLSPDTIQFCAGGEEREVSISGRNFEPKSLAVFDGAAIKTRFQGAEALSFTVPAVAAGLHQIQVRNPEDTVSGALGLTIDARPEITGVVRGDEFVNYYNLLIDGRNFQQGSTLVVMEESSVEQGMGGQPQIEVKRLRSGASSATERDRVIYSSCSRIIYQRNPYSNVLKNFRVQVVNPNGEESSVVQVTAP